MQISEAIERTYGYLYPGGVDLPRFDTLDADITAGAASLTTSGLVSYIPQGLIEIDSELILTKESESSTTVDLNERGFWHSTAAAHTAGAKIWIDPEFFRIDIFNAISAVIAQMESWGLYRRTVDATNTSYTSDTPFDLESGARDVLSILVTENSTSQRRVRLREGLDYDVIQEYDPPKVQIYNPPTRGSTMRIVYRKDFTLPTSEADDLTTTCGVPSQLAPWLPMAAAGILLMGREAPVLDFDTIRRQMGQDEPQVGARISIGQGYLDNFKRNFVEAELVRQRRRDPWRMRFVR